MSPDFWELYAGLSSVQQPDRVFRCRGTQVHVQHTIRSQMPSGLQCCRQSLRHWQLARPATLWYRDMPQPVRSLHGETARGELDIAPVSACSSTPARSGNSGRISSSHSICTTPTTTGLRTRRPIPTMLESCCRSDGATRKCRRRCRNGRRSRQTPWRSVRPGGGPSGMPSQRGKAVVCHPRSRAGMNVRTVREADTAPQASQPAGMRVAHTDVFVLCGLRNSR